MAMPTPLLTDPPTLLLFQEVIWGTLGKMPSSTRKQAKYLTLGISTAMRITKPMILLHNQTGSSVFVFFFWAQDERKQNPGIVEFGSKLTL